VQHCQVRRLHLLPVDPAQLFGAYGTASGAALVTAIL
jgi:hypothetical protein